MRYKNKPNFRRFNFKRLFLVLLCIIIIIFFFSSIFPNITLSLSDSALFSAGLNFPEGGMLLLNRNQYDIQHLTRIPDTTHDIEDTKRDYADNNSSSDNSASHNSASEHSRQNLSSASPIVSQAQISPENALPISEQTLPRSGINYQNIWLKNSTDFVIDIADQLNKPFDFKLKKANTPVVLIVHTHTTEAYRAYDNNIYDKTVSSRSNDENYNVIKVGKSISESLKKANIGVIHDTTVHDSPSYNGSYFRSEDTIKNYLKKYPSIQIVLDIHRDSIQLDDGTRIKPTATINGKKAAQVMLIAGCESEDGYPFPDWEMNLRLNLKLQQALESTYPSLARTMKFMYAEYNMSLTHGSMLLEIGTESNTIDEASYTGELVGNVLADVLKKLK